MDLILVAEGLGRVNQRMETLSSPNCPCPASTNLLPSSSHSLFFCFLSLCLPFSPSSLPLLFTLSPPTPHFSLSLLPLSSLSLSPSPSLSFLSLSPASFPGFLTSFPFPPSPFPLFPFFLFPTLSPCYFSFPSFPVPSFICSCFSISPPLQSPSPSPFLSFSCPLYSFIQRIFIEPQLCCVHYAILWILVIM